MIKFLLILILFLIINVSNAPQSLAATYYLCEYKYTNIKKEECKVLTIASVYPNSCNETGSNNTECTPTHYDPDIACFTEFYSPSYTGMGFIPDVLSGSLEVKAIKETVVTGSMTPEQQFNQIGVFQEDGTKNYGCKNKSSTNCQNLFELIKSKLEKKFPLDIFVPVYNFTSSNTACPKIVLLDQEMEFCAIVMVAKAIKYIFLIAFIVRNLTNF